jgi:hypothetical protein
MFTLSELVKFRNDLIVRLQSITLADDIDENIQLLKSTITKNPGVDKSLMHDKIDHAINEYLQLKEKSLAIQQGLISEISTVNQLIDDIANNINSSNIKNISAFQITNELNHLILIRIQKYADWRFPALRLGCGYVGQYYIDSVDRSIQKNNLLSIEYSNHMVAGDPLYFCDIDPKIIESATDHFNSIYQKRIRKYTIADDDLSILPQNQFGFIFAWMQFNFWNLSTVELYLGKIFKLLCPGGSMMFSYNNSDLEESAELVDINTMQHIPKRNLIKLCEYIGFEISADYDIPNTDSFIKYISWLEIKRPGEMRAIKLCPILGQILEK